VIRLVKIIRLVLSFLALSLMGCASLTLEVDSYKGDLPVLSSEAKVLADSVLESEWYNADTREMFYKAFLDDVKKPFLETQKSIYIGNLGANQDKKQKSKYEKEYKEEFYNYYMMSNSGMFSIDFKRKFTKLEEKLKKINLDLDLKNALVESMEERQGRMVQLWAQDELKKEEFEAELLEINKELAETKVEMHSVEEQHRRVADELYRRKKDKRDQEVKKRKIEIEMAEIKAEINNLEEQRQKMIESEIGEEGQKKAIEKQIRESSKSLSVDEAEKEALEILIEKIDKEMIKVEENRKAIEAHELELRKGWKRKEVGEKSTELQLIELNKELLEKEKLDERKVKTIVQLREKMAEKEAIVQEKMKIIEKWAKDKAKEKMNSSVVKKEIEELVKIKAGALAKEDWTGIETNPDTGIQIHIDEEWKNIDDKANEVRSAAERLLGQILNSSGILTEQAAGDFVELQIKLHGSSQNQPGIRLIKATLKALKTTKPQIDENKFINRLMQMNSFKELESSYRHSAGIAASAEVGGRLVGYPIFDPRITHLKDTEKVWSEFVKDSFNGYWGNTQFVVVREGHLIYHMKSLDFDPTEAAGAGAATARLGLQVGSALASGATGLPLGALAPKGSGSTQKGSSEINLIFNESEMKANQDILDQRQRAKRELLRDLANLYDDAKDVNSKQETIQNRFTEYIKYFQGRLGLKEIEK